MIEFRQKPVKYGHPLNKRYPSRSHGTFYINGRKTMVHHFLCPYNFSCQEKGDKLAGNYYECHFKVVNQSKWFVAVPGIPLCKILYSTGTSVSVATTNWVTVDTSCVLKLVLKCSSYGMFLLALKPKFMILIQFIAPLFCYTYSWWSIKLSGASGHISHSGFKFLYKNFLWITNHR